MQNNLGPALIAEFIGTLALVFIERRAGAGWGSAGQWRSGGRWPTVW